MKTVRMFLGLTAFAVAIFIACSDNEFVPPLGLLPSCGEEGEEECPPEPEYSSPSPGYSSDDPWSVQSSPSLSSTGTTPGTSSTTSTSPSSSTAQANPSSTTVAGSSSAAYVPPTPGSNCSYQASYCGGIAFGDIKTTSVTGDAPEGPACLFATAISKLGNENGQGGGIRVNGTKLVGGWNSDVGGRCGNTDWGQQTCAEALKSVAKVDGGYYIYVPAWAGDFVTTGGTPTCSNPQPQPSSASAARSSSSVATVVRSSSSGGTTNPSSAARSSAGGTGTLSCGSVPSTGTVGQPLSIPTVTCNGSTVTGSAITWSGSPSAPNWNTPTAGTYTNIRASVNVGTCGGLQATCAGNLTVSTPPSSSSLPPDPGTPNLENLQGASGVRNGVTTRYWDGCKASCGWTSNTGGSPNGTAKSCDVRGTVVGNNVGSACTGGTSYTCMSQVPWRKSDNISYGFAASHSNGDCGKCFHIQFTNTAIKDKKMIVMISNIGGDVGNTQFDLMIPGGGVGQYDALSKQIRELGGSANNLGQQYGGFRATCGNNASCVRDMCNSAFSGSGLADLRAGCLWYVDWFQIADNPNTLVKEITCPNDLINKYK